MKSSAIIVCPGRGSYNTDELGYLARYHGDKRELLSGFDSYRQRHGQETITGLDGAGKFNPAEHTRGDNASPLIFTAAYCDFLSIDRNRYEIVGATGNSMGWYIALACANALTPADGFRLVNTMGTLMQDHLVGGQILYPFMDSDWRPVSGKRAEIEGKIAEIDLRQGCSLALSIDLGGVLAIGGNENGLAAFEAEMPKVDDRFPMRLMNHAAFHTALQEPVVAEGRASLGREMFSKPSIPLIDGRGGIWWPDACYATALREYTLDHQIVQTYDFTKAVATAAREFMPDVFIVLGPGTTLGGPVAQSLIRVGWRGWTSKTDFKAAQADTIRLINMGDPEQRGMVVDRTE